MADEKPDPQPHQNRPQSGQQPPSYGYGMSPPPPPPPGYHPGYAPQPQPPSGRGGSGVMSKVTASLVTTLLMVSLGLNAYFIIYFVAVNASLRGPSESTFVAGTTSERIVIVPIRGGIDDSTAAFIRKALDQLRQNKPSAVILRIDSGGGGVAASDRIWNLIKQFKDETNIPIVASFGAVAASGGYYVAAPADYIMAEPTGITGSIGVMAPVFTVDRLLDKIGITPETIVATESPQKIVANDIMRPWTDEDRDKVRMLLDSAQARFVEVVHDGRKDHLSIEEVRILANGDIYTTRQAVENKLIDGEGYIDDAIAKAKSLANLTPTDKVTVNILEPARQFSLTSLLMQNQTPSAESLLTTDNVRRWVGELSTLRLEYRMTP